MRDLTPKQEKFAENYIASGNATQSAISAGYSENTASEQGYDNLRKPQIQEYIKARQKDAKVHTDEIIGTLVSHMRGDITLMLDDVGNFDLDKARELKVTHLIKKYKITTRFIPIRDSEPEKEVKVELELHDPQAAAKHLCSVFGLEKLPAANPETLKALDAAVDRFIEKAAERGIEITPEAARDRLMPYFESQAVS